jgi:hypothetical protein
VTARQREIAVTMRGIFHITWVMGVASLVAWLSPRADFLPTLVAVVLAHSAWRAGEFEVERAQRENPEC